MGAEKVLDAIAFIIVIHQGAVLEFVGKQFFFFTALDQARLIDKADNFRSLLVIDDDIASVALVGDLHSKIDDVQTRLVINVFS